jgi:hypothetical protein
MKIKENNIVIYILLFLLFIPTSPIVGGYYFWFFVLNSLLIFLLIHKQYISHVAKYFHKYTLLYIISSCYLLAISILFESSVAGKDFNEIIRWITYLLIYVCVYNYIPDSIKQYDKLLFFLQKVLKFFLLVEFIAVFIQSNSFILNLFGLIWDMHKYWPMRRIGTCDNPNTLSILITIAYTCIYLLEKNSKQKIFYFFISLIVILLSGSRTGLISFMLIFLVNYLMLNKFTIKTFFLFFGVICLFTIVFQFLLTKIPAFIYMSEILKLFERSDMSGVRTLDFRHNLWIELLDMFYNSSFVQILFGVGPSKNSVFHIIDNDYLTIFIKTGIIGSFLSILFYFGNSIYFFFNRKYIFSKLMISVMLIFAISAYTGATFTSWYLAQFFFFFYTLAHKEIQIRKNDNNNNSDIQTQRVYI